MKLNIVVDYFFNVSSFALCAHPELVEGYKRI